MSKHTKKEYEEAKADLLELLKPGDTIFTMLVHRSRSGMYRVIDLFVIKDNEPLRLSYNASILLEGYDRKWEGCRASGCGMDMGFHLVYSLGHALWPEGFECIGNKCPSNDHFNGDRNHKPHHHDSGGYALQQRWL
jgi:hypothetical protein